MRLHEVRERGFMRCRFLFARVLEFDMRSELGVRHKGVAGHGERRGTTAGSHDRNAAAATAAAALSKVTLRLQLHGMTLIHGRRLHQWTRGDGRAGRGSEGVH